MEFGRACPSTNLRWGVGPLPCTTPRGSLAATATGAITRVEHALGSSRTRLQPTGENELPNPSLAIDTFGWAYFGGADTFEVGTDLAVVGETSLKFTRGVAAGSSFVALTGISLGPTATYFASAYVRVFGGFAASDIRLESVDFSGVTQTYQRVWTPADGEGVWVRLETRIVTTSATSGTIRLRTSGSAPPAGGGFYIDAAQLEVGERATSYCDGSLGEGYAWTGTPHASASTRAAGALSLPGAPVAVARGGLFAWLRPSWPADDGATRTLLHRQSGAGEAWRVGFDPTEDAWVMELVGAEVATSVRVPSSHAVDADVFLAAGWDERHLWLSDGGTTSLAPLAGPPPAIPRSTPIEVGRRQDDLTDNIDAVVGPLVFLDGPPSREDVVAASRFRRLPDWPRAPRTVRVR